MVNYIIGNYFVSKVNLQHLYSIFFNSHNDTRIEKNVDKHRVCRYNIKGMIIYSGQGGAIHVNMSKE